MAKKNKFLYKAVFQVKKPKGKWTDRKTFTTTGSNYELGTMAKQSISKMKREFKQDLPKYETRVIKRKVKA